jgi:hypothetical protein
MPQIRHTYCRICESACCLAVTVETDAAGEGRIVRVTPDKQHPASRGFACVKGIRYGGIHHDKERVNPPQANRRPFPTNHLEAGHSGDLPQDPGPEAKTRPQAPCPLHGKPILFRSRCVVVPAGK